MQPASATRDDANLTIGSDELAEGLMLVRASTLKVIRLQLAMERRDRRVALEAVDDLVALDRSLEEFLTQVPSAHVQGLFRNVLELERFALNAEKHTLAGEISNRSWRPPESGDAEPPELDRSSEWSAFDEDEAPRSRWLLRTAAVVALLVLAGTAYLLGASGFVPDFMREVL